MAIIRRFIAVIRSYLNYWVGKAEDPEKMLNQILQDMKKQFIDAKKQTALAISDERRLFKNCEDEKTAADDWEKKAAMAVKMNRDDLAKQALNRHADHKNQFIKFEKHWQLQKAAVEQLKIALNELGEKIENSNRQKNLLSARAKRAEAQKMITETISGLSGNSAFETIERMEEKINRIEAEASASAEIANESGDKLSKEFEELGSIKTDEALRLLKEKMKKDTLKLDSSFFLKNQEKELKNIEDEIKAEVIASKNRSV